MDRRKFVSAITSEVYEVSIRDTVRDLHDPPGRQPSAQQLELQKWFAEADERTRTMTASVIALACDHAVFGFLAVLDGVRTIESVQPKGTLHLQFEKNGTTEPLNGLTDQLLHDIFRTLLATHVSNVEAESKALDIHHVPPVEAGLRCIPGYNPLQAPAIALPTRQHRNIPSEAASDSRTFQDEVEDALSRLQKHTNVPDSSIHPQ